MLPIKKPYKDMQPFSRYKAVTPRHALSSLLSLFIKLNPFINPSSLTIHKILEEEEYT